MPVTRHYGAERALPILEDAAAQHPLLETPKAVPVTVTKAAAASVPVKSVVVDDPLGADTIDDPLGASKVNDDPLTAALSAALTKSDSMISSASSSSLLRSSSSMSASAAPTNYQNFQMYQDDADEQRLLFAPRKAGILTKYTTTESINIPGFVAGVGRRTLPLPSLISISYRAADHFYPLCSTQGQGEGALGAARSVRRG